MPIDAQTRRTIVAISVWRPVVMLSCPGCGNVVAGGTWPPSHEVERACLFAGLAQLVGPFLVGECLCSRDVLHFVTHSEPSFQQCSHPKSEKKKKH